MHILGVLLPDNQLVKHALTHFYGIGKKTSQRLCARVQIHDRCRIRNLNQSQVTALTAFLSSPPTRPPQMRENIAHQRMIGSYVGRRHAMHLPVRGQNTQSNARTARKLNRVERYN
ncbi:hypothetical protein C8T65DRAFT_565811 [Cerioporus squamosus]|nr:hypothetical protein C8T65DRAFT_565811 [Cerioporus squamosus]